MIGVFDSGNGGLTVLKALVARLPDQGFVYLGDHARAPYGAHSPEEILFNTRRHVDWLFRRGCRLVLLACNTASAVALRSLQQDWLPEAHPDKRVLGVLVPMVEAVTGLPWYVKRITPRPPGPAGTVGLFATRRSVDAGTFTAEIGKRAAAVRVIAQACPALVASIEAGAGDDELRPLVQGYVDALYAKAAGDPPTAIILGCTHYQLIRDCFAAALPDDVALFDQPAIVADSLAGYLDRHPALSGAPASATGVRLITTGDPERINPRAQHFFAGPVAFERLEAAAA